MNTTVAREWLKRLFGWGLPLISGFVTMWVGKEMGSADAGAAVGSAVATVGAVVANKAIPYIIPDESKVAAANQMPKPFTLVRGGSAPLSGPGGDPLRK